MGEIRVLWVGNEPPPETELADARIDATTTTPDHALETLRKGDFECVLVDGDSPAVAERLCDHASEVPVIVRTDAHDDSVAAAAVRAGASEYVCQVELADAEDTLADRLLANAKPRTATSETVGSTDGGTSKPSSDAEDGTENGFVPDVGAITDSLPDGIVAIDADGTIRYANETLADLCGYDRPALVGEPIAAILPERHRNDFDPRSWGVENGRRDLDLTVEHADGHEVPVVVSLETTTHGGETYVTGTLTDASDSAGDQERLRTAERRFETLFQHPSTLVGILDTDGTILSGNESALSFADLEQDDVVGEYFWETPWWTHSEELQAEIEEKVLRAVGGETQTYEAEHFNPDGDRIVVSGTIQPVVGANGDVTSVIVTGTDVTERVDLNVRLRERERSLRNLYRISTDGDLTFEERVHSLLDAGRERLGLEYGFFTRVSAGEQEVVHTRGDHPKLQAGTVVPLAESYCRKTITNDDITTMADVSDSLEEDDPGLERFQLESYLGANVSVDDEPFGTVCFADPTPREAAFDDADETYVSLLAEWLGRELEQRSYEHELESARERFHRVLERIDDAFFALDDDWRFTYLNGKAEQMINPDQRALVGERIWDAFTEGSVDVYREQYEQAMETQQPVSFEERYEPADMWIEVNAYPSSDGLSVFLRDVTERKQREEMLTGLVETSRELLRADSVDDVARIAAAVTKDVLGFDLNVVRLYDENTGTLEAVASSDRTMDQLSSRPDYDVGEGNPGRVFESGEPLVVDEFDDSIETDRGVVRAAMYFPLGEYGTLSIASAQANAFTETDRQAAELLATTTEAAFERAKRQQALSRYETVLENVQGMLYVLDENGVFTMVTEPLADRVGYDRETLVGEHASIVLDDEGIEQGRELIRDLLKSEDSSKSYETTYVGQDGKRFPVKVDVSLLPFDDSFQGTVGVARDISTLKETRQALAAENDRFRFLFEHIPDPAVEVKFIDETPMVRGVNTAFENVFGFDKDDIRGENLNEYLVPDDERDEARQIDEMAKDGTVITQEVQRRTTNGIRTFLFRGLVYTYEDEPYGFGIYTDITEQKDRERRLQVLHTVLRHNLRTEMTLIRGYADSLDERLDEDAAEIDSIREGIETVGTLSDKVQQIERAIEHADLWKTGAVDVVGMVENTVERYRNACPRADVSLDVPASAVAVADERLEFAVDNLLENAIEHAGPAPSIAVSVTQTDEWVEVRVGDDGPGIPESERELVTGDRDITQIEHGSGLGLWVVTWVASAYGGTIDFEPSPLGGTTVVVRLSKPGHAGSLSGRT